VSYRTYVEQPERKQWPQAEFDADPLYDGGAEERHQRKGDWQTVPRESVISRRKMVIGRSRGDERHAGEEGSVRPSLFRYNKKSRNPRASLPKQKSKSKYSHEYKRCIGENI